MRSKMTPWAYVLAVPDMNKSAQYFTIFLASTSVGRTHQIGDWSRGMAFG